MLFSLGVFDVCSKYFFKECSADLFIANLAVHDVKGIVIVFNNLYKASVSTQVTDF